MWGCEPTIGATMPRAFEKFAWRADCLYIDQYEELCLGRFSRSDRVLEQITGERRRARVVGIGGVYGRGHGHLRSARLVLEQLQHREKFSGRTDVRVAHRSDLRGRSRR